MVKVTDSIISARIPRINTAFISYSAVYLKESRVNPYLKING